MLHIYGTQHRQWWKKIIKLIQWKNVGRVTGIYQLCVVWLVCLMMQLTATYNVIPFAFDEYMKRLSLGFFLDFCLIIKNHEQKMQRLHISPVHPSIFLYRCIQPTITDWPYSYNISTQSLFWCTREKEFLFYVAI